jgi:signal transduction histidine kinase
MKRMTIRVRLTILYGGLFLAAGAALLGVTYLLVEQSIGGSGKGEIAMVEAKSVAAKSTDPIVKLSNGRQVTVQQATELIKQQNEALHADTLNSLLTRGGIALGGVGVIAFGLGWLLAERALRPVHEITATARRVASADGTAHGLHERIALTGPRDEIKELADTFDDMLERLDRSFDGQRRFVANASHELRTPLAINRALVEVAITRPGAGPELRQLGDTLLAVNARHERLIDGLLTLAESDNRLTERSLVDLRDVAAHVLEQARTGDRTISDRQLESGTVSGDPVLLERLTQNLVHNDSGGWLSITTGARDGYATLSVTNTGPVVAPYELDTIFEPFRRLAGDRTGSERGAGLGLSIVRAVARAHGGVACARPRPGGGLTVTIRLPLSSRHPATTGGTAMTDEARGGAD